MLKNQSKVLILTTSSVLIHNIIVVMGTVCSMQPMAKTGHISGSYEAVALPRNSRHTIEEYWEETRDTAVGSTAAHLARKMEQRRISYEYLSLLNP